MTKLKNLLLLIFISIFCGCSNHSEIYENTIPKKINDFAKAYISNIHDGNIDTCLFLSGAEINNEKGRTFLTNTHNNIKYFEAKSIKIVGFNISATYGSKKFKNYTIDYEYDYGTFAYFSLNIQEKENKLTVVGFNGQIYDKPLSEINKFTFSGKGFLNFFFLLMLLIIPAFIVITIIYIAKTPMRRKWLWIIGALVGFMGFYLNWTTGEFRFQFFTFKLLGIGFVKNGLVAPWIASFSIPIIAIIFWFKRQSFIVNDEFERELENKKTESDELKKNETSINE